MKGRLKRTALKSKTTSTDNQKMEISDKTQKGHFKGNMDSLQSLLRGQMLDVDIWQESKLLLRGTVVYNRGQVS